MEPHARAARRIARSLALLLVLGAIATPALASTAFPTGVGAGRGNRTGAEPPAAPEAPSMPIGGAGVGPGIGAALPVPTTFAPPSPGRIAATYTVTTTADTGAGSLSAAVTAANQNPDVDLIEFAIPGGGVQTLFPKGTITLTQPVILDATTQPGWTGSPLIELDGSLAGANAVGIAVTGGFSAIRGFIINRYRTTGSGGYGIMLNNAGFNTIQNCWIGTNATGTVRVGNAVGGIVVFGASGDNVIGGTTAATRNVISGNPGSGIHLATGNVGRNIVRGNWIGLSATGDTLANGGNGIFLDSPDNVIGGTVPGARNVISSNGYPGIFIGFAADRTTIQGNYIGTDPTGTLDRGNFQNGINIDRADDCLIGGNTPEARNVIAGNEFPNVYVFGPATRNRIQGNYIGIDAAGLVGLGDGNAVVIDNATNNHVGGAGAGEGNVISGHPFTAVVIQNAGATANTVKGNLIGTTASGNVAVPNSRGVLVVNANRNVIGGPAAGERNVVSGNDLYGIELRNANNCRVSGNHVGTDVTGLLDVGNRLHGIVVVASNDTIGGTSGAFGNLVRFNGRAGIYDSTGTANLLRFNRTSDNRALGIDLFPRGITPNDSLDNDAGVNGAPNFPVLDSISVLPGNTRVFGRLDSRANTAYTLDFYLSTTADTAHFGEGQAHLGSMGVTTDATGRAAIDFDAGIVVSDDLFVTAMATDAAGNSSEFSPTLCLADRDRDGIRDCWETPGWPVDINSDGIYDLDLEARGADPDFVDVFVEVDAMAGYAPPQAALDSVRLAFEGLPASYLNAAPHVQGIQLWTEVSDVNVPVQDLPTFWTGFQAIKAAYFGTAVERASPNRVAALRAKQMFYRYGLWARTFGTWPDTLASGYGEGSEGNGGDDFMVTLGSTCPDSCWNNTQDVDVHAGTYMHELGHTFGLRHGGVDHIHHKPNYYSVMNYLWQTPKPWQTEGVRRLDYSRFALAPLVESNLDETLGLQVPPNVWPVTTMPYSDSTGFTNQALLMSGWGGEDWTGDGQELTGRVVDLNRVGGMPASPGETLTSRQDWSSLVVNFRTSAEYTPAGTVPEEQMRNGEPEPVHLELTRAMDTRLRAIPPPRPGGIFVMDGQRDPSSMLVASNAGVNLYAAYRPGPLGGQVYLATEGAQAGRDVAVLLAKVPGALRPAPLGKSGSVAAWDAFLVRRGLSLTAEWRNGIETTFDNVVVDSAGAFLEGVVNIDLLRGEHTTTYAVALASYAAAPGGTLLAQAPAGDGDGDVEASEWVQLTSSNVGVPSVPGAPVGGRVLLSNARPNPAFGSSRVRLSLPRAADVVATVQDVAGRTVATLMRGPLNAGEHEISWSAAGGAGRKPAPGVYFIVVRALGEERTARVVVLN